MPHDQVYDAVRYVMWRWGRIYWLRVDNGSPFGDPTRRALSILHLCLAAHGIGLKVNPPRTPTKNAKVERNQGTTARWSEPGKCKDYLEFQYRLNEAVIDQRQHYPSRVCGYKTRVEAYPRLLKNPARFSTQDFDLQRVYKLLAQGRWQRRVSPRGSVNLFWEYYQLGRPQKGKKVFATFNLETLHWDFFCSKGNLMKSMPLKNLTSVQLINGIKRLKPKQKG